MSETGGGGGGAEVRIKLVADDAATETTNKLKESLKGSSDELEKGHGHAENLGHELFKAELYVELFKKGAELVAEGIHQAWEMAEKLADASMEAADEANQQVRASSGLMMLMDRGAHSMGQIRDYAKDVREELEAAGTKAGVSTGQMEEMFDRVIERGGRSTKSAEELTEQMAMVGKVVPGGMGSLAEGFNMMELGVIRARNPLIQLISATGELHGNAKQVAQQMMKMTPTEQMEIATKAIEKQAELMKAGGAGGAATFVPTLPELKASFGNIREGFLEAVGQPMLDKIVPSLVSLRDYLMEHSEQIRAYGEEIGNAVGNVVSKVEGLLGEVYSGAVEDWDAIAANMSATGQTMLDTWSIVVGDGQSIHHSLKEAAKDVSEAFKTGAEYFKATVETFQDIGEQLSAIGAGIKGAGEWMLGDIDQGVTDMKRLVETPWGGGTAKANAAVAQEGARTASMGVGTGADKTFEAALDKYRAWSAEAGVAASVTDDFTMKLREFHEAEQENAQRVKSEVESGDVTGIGSYINSAVANHNEASEKWVFNLIAHSDAMAKALLDGSIQVDGGFEALQAVIAEQSPELAKKLKEVGGAIDPTKGIAGQHGPTINFNGGQQFNIKQDFRDQDPDRVMEVFRRDLQRAATSRRGSRMGTAFGL
jgi:hypothetical protein